MHFTPIYRETYYNIEYLVSFLQPRLAASVITCSWLVKMEDICSNARACVKYCLVLDIIQTRIKAEIYQIMIYSLFHINKPRPVNFVFQKKCSLSHAREAR
jgi:hypothetical protein